MTTPIDLSAPASDAAVALIAGISRQAIAAMRSDGRIAGVTNLELFRSYCDRLRRSAAGRASDADDPGALDVAQETARLKRAQAAAQELKNAAARSQFAPVEILTDTLHATRQAVIEQFDGLEHRVRLACPALPAAALGVVAATIAAARSEWAMATTRLLTAHPAEDDDDDERDDRDQDSARLVRADR